MCGFRYTDSQPAHYEQYLTKGASIHDVCRIFGFFDPLPPLSEFYVLFVRKFGVFLDPPLCGRRILKPLTAITVVMSVVLETCIAVLYSKVITTTYT